MHFLTTYVPSLLFLSSPSASGQAELLRTKIIGGGCCRASKLSVSLVLLAVGFLRFDDCFVDFLTNFFDEFFPIFFDEFLTNFFDECF